MNKFLKINPEWFLRLGLGGVYLYTSVDIFRHPTGWYWAIRPLPQVFQNIINGIGVDNYLMTQATGELIIALVLLAWFLPRRIVGIAGLLIALQMFSILALVGISLDTFRDIGLLGGGLTLFALSLKEENRQ